MPHVSACKLCAFMPLVAVVIGGLALRATPAPDQEGSAPAHNPQPVARLQKTKETLYYGNSLCGSDCHGREQPAADNMATVGIYSTLFSRRHEAFVWNSEDKHKIATVVLTQGPGKEMAARLGLDVKDLTDPKANLGWRQCLSCHGVPLDDPTLAHPSFGPQERIESGVSCVVCHGADRRWVNEHMLVAPEVPWKSYTRTAKYERFGLRDLWDPVKRAELCCSCHVGNAAEGKFVTHAMYAAGHPPLPGFEILHFGDEMPRHWETLQQKLTRLPQAKEIYVKAYQLASDNLEQAAIAEQGRLLLASAAVSLHDFATSIHKYAHDAQAAAPDGGNQSWPEFALYDCYACHHELKADSWRQRRGYQGPPGRPQMPEWPNALVPVALHALIAEVGRDPATVSANLKKARHDLTAALARAPFGVPREVADKANALAEASKRLIEAVEQCQIDRAGAEVLIKLLVDRPRGELLDFDSARQVSWAARSLINAIDRDALTRPALKSSFEALSNQLNLELPKLSKKQGPIMATELYRDTRAKLANFNPDLFQEHMRTLAKAYRAK